MAYLPDKQHINFYEDIFIHTQMAFVFNVCWML